MGGLNHILAWQTRREALLALSLMVHALSTMSTTSSHGCPEPTSDVSTAFLEAAMYGRNELIQALIAKGSVVNLGNHDSVTPLHLACLSGNTSTVSLLLNHGAQINAWNVDGSTPLCDACCSGDPELVKLLLKNGADVNPKLCMTSPLHEAMMRDKWECANLLCQAGAKLNAMDCHFGTPLHVAAWKKYVRSAFVILQAGANVNSAKVLATALHYSAKAKDLPLIKLLLDFGANVYASDNHGKLASDLVPCNHPIHTLLKEYEGQPRSLMACCRFVIRQSIGPRGLESMSNLKLPTFLQNYLEYCEYSHLLSSEFTTETASDVR